MKPKHTRLFNIDHARAGAPFCGSNGEAVRVLIWDRSHPTHPIVAMEVDGEQEIIAFTAKGETGHGCAHLVSELVMLPLGLVQGDPFFVGDEIVGATGAKFIADPQDKDGEHDAWKWPAPEKVYPETRLSYEALCVSGGMSLTSMNSIAIRAIANAALRHAIDAGQVITKADHEAELYRLGESLRDIEITRNSLRDFAIAEAVRVAVLTQWNPARGYPVHEDAQEILARGRALNLDAIIATVKEK